MVKDIFRTLLSVLALSLALTPSIAQAPAPSILEPRKPFALTAGGFLPFSGNAVTLGSASYLSVGFSYFPTRSRLGFRADYVRGQSNRGELNSLGVGPAYQVPAGRLRGNRIHYGVSLGVFRTSARQTEPKRSESGTGLGGRLYGGMEIRENLLVEISYSDFPGALGAHPRGFALHVGSRF